MDALLRLLRFLRLRRSPSRGMMRAGREFISVMQRGIEQSDARRAELLASGLSPEEAQAVMLRELLDWDAAHPEFMEHTHRIVMRSFGTLYEDDDEPGSLQGGRKYDA